MAQIRFRINYVTTWGESLWLDYGASSVNHLAELIQAGTGLKVNVSENPVTSVALGLSKIIKDDNYKSVAYSIEELTK